MAQREKSRGKKSRLAGAKTAIRRTASRIGKQLRPSRRKPEAAAAAPAVAPAKPRKRISAKQARPTQRKTDIPLDLLNQYTPKQTSLKASFRADGKDHERDQELAGGYADERWHDEDRLTNRSGDPRIGTHRRKYEPGE